MGQNDFRGGMAYAKVRHIVYPGDPIMKRLVIAVLAILVTACGEGITPPPQPALLGSELTFYRFSSDAFEHAPREAGFWAVKGEDRSLVLRYTDTHAEFMRFEVDASSLWKRPDGSAFQSGDSIYISVNLDSSGRMIFRFAPSGLKFDARQAARLTIDSSRRNADINGNGSVGPDDVLLALRAGIWKQELPLLPWLKLPGVNLAGDVATVDIHDFTGFGMAVN